MHGFLDDKNLVLQSYIMNTILYQIVWAKCRILNIVEVDIFLGDKVHMFSL